MHSPYSKIAEAIQFIQTHFKDQPSLEEIATQVGLSPSHFQRLFTEWVGTSPKKFVQYLTLSYAKEQIQHHSIFDTTWNAGLSSTSRLHDLFIQIEAMTPAEYKNEGHSLRIAYSFAQSPFGELLIASTSKGICHLSFFEDAATALDPLRQRFPKSVLVPEFATCHTPVLQFFKQDWSDLPTVKVHLKGTEFQLKIWEMLLKIPYGRLTSYGEIAEKIGNPKAVRAVGTAIGANPIAYLIPCHRVLQSSGALGGYRWNLPRKSAMIGWEACSLDLKD